MNSLKPVIRDCIDIRKAAEYALQMFDGGRSQAGDPLGEGASGQVYRGRAIVKGCIQDVVIKYARSPKDDKVPPRKKITRLLREILAWRYLRHRNVAEFYGLDFSGTNVDLIQNIDITDQDPHRQLRLPGLVSPYFEYSILEYVVARPELREECVNGLARGLTYIHKNLIVHGDVRPENVRVDAHGCTKLIDFGFSRWQRCSGFTTDNFTGLSLRYNAPEIFINSVDVSQSSRPTFKSDVYSFGMCMLQVLAHPDSPSTSQPFNHITEPECLFLPYYEYICQNKGRPIREQYLTNFADSRWRLMEECWCDNENERPTMHRVFEQLIGTRCNKTYPCWL